MILSCCRIWCERGRSKSSLQSAESGFLPSMVESAPTIISVVAALVILRSTGALVIHHDIHLWSAQNGTIRTAWWISRQFLLTEIYAGFSHFIYTIFRARLMDPAQWLCPSFALPPFWCHSLECCWDLLEVSKEHDWCAYFQLEVMIRDSRGWQWIEEFHRHIICEVVFLNWDGWKVESLFCREVSQAYMGILVGWLVDL